MESESNFAEVTGNKPMDSAEKRLNELGYKQELRREMVFVLLPSCVFDPADFSSKFIEKK